jgi:hypothetical protein
MRESKLENKEQISTKLIDHPRITDEFSNPKDVFECGQVMSTKNVTAYDLHQ